MGAQESAEGLNSSIKESAPVFLQKEGRTRLDAVTDNGQEEDYEQDSPFISVHRQSELSAYQRMNPQCRKSCFNVSFKRTEASTTNATHVRNSNTAGENISQNRSIVRSVEPENGSFVGTFNTPGLTQRSSIVAATENLERERRTFSRSPDKLRRNTLSFCSQAEISAPKFVFGNPASVISVEEYLRMMKEISRLLQTPLPKTGTSVEDIFTLAASRQHVEIPASRGKSPSGDMSFVCVQKLKAKYAESRQILADAGSTSSHTGKVSLPALILEDCSLYCGEWRGELMDGQGLQVYPDGSTYTGQWKNGKAHGLGNFSTHLGKYSGQFLEGKAHGRGTYECAKGTKIEGEWISDVLSGHAVELRPDGYRLEVNYVNGRREGNANGILGPGIRFRVCFQQDQILGDYQISFPTGDTYVGQIEEGRMHGRGLFRWADGRTYQGQYKDDLKDGYGEFTFTDGRIYKGYWRAGRQNGEGALHYPDGSSQVFQWENGFRTKR